MTSIVSNGTIMGKSKAAKSKNAVRRKRTTFSPHEIAARERAARLTYSWRYVDHERAESGDPRGDHCHGVNMLMPSTMQKIEKAYQNAIGIPRCWQVIVILYLNKGEEESRNWSWVRSQQPIIASGEGITPLIAEANQSVLSDMSDDEHCHARAVIAAPWDSQHPIHPAKFISALKTKLKLNDQDIQAVSEWAEPANIKEVSLEKDIDLEIAKILQGQDKLYTQE